MQVNLIPLAGAGSRFSGAGYILPKPLINVSSVPMILKAVRDMPPADKWIFAVRKEHIEEYALDKIIYGEIKDAHLITIDKTTDGTVCTCLLAEDLLDKDDSLFIASCDVGYMYDKKKHASLVKQKDIDMISWTFTQRKMLSDNPTAWGWYGLEPDGETIKKVSVKTPVSKDPYNDHAVVSSFYFRTADVFLSAARRMLKEKRRTNNEYYVDALPAHILEMGGKSAIFDVDLFVCWGDPKSLHEYERWEYLCNNRIIPKGMDEEEKRMLPLWEKYFSRPQVE